MKAKFTLIAAGFLLAFEVHAADINCGGRISYVMADHPGCNGNMAFKTEATGGIGGIWMCTRSKEGNSVVVASMLDDRTVLVYIEGSDAGGICTQLPHYRAISYVIINP